MPVLQVLYYIIIGIFVATASFHILILIHLCLHPQRRDQLPITAANNACESDVRAPAPASLFPFSRDAADSAHSRCAVCMGDFEDGDKAEKLPGCGHVYHQICIDPWLRIHPTCPICRDSAALPPPLAKH